VSGDVLWQARAIERMVRAAIQALPRDGSFVVMEPGDDGWPTGLAGRITVPIRAWKSRNFIVQLHDRAEEGLQRLSVQRAGANAGILPQNRDLRPISWDELMAVKSDCGFADSWACELLPAAGQVVDVAPMRHIWILSQAPTFGWRR
jgi:hypothetical protein